ncbi:UNVERIFIED_CONTAM: putative transcription factor [Sesamum angustifolium]|uniref:Transcription factor n=1 Tax=Sesamum angustifolium TaxID=2727405 RepID=A0AAW2NWI5_9LAMI
MASAGDPSAAAAAAAAAAGNIFNEDEDLLEDDDDDESSDHDEDDSASSAALAVDRPPPSTSATQVTIAVPGIPDPLLITKQQQQQETMITKKPAALPDESRKLFQRLWTDEDEIELLQGFLDYTTQRCGPHNSSQQHHHDTTAFYDQIKSKFQLDFNKNQLVEKLRRLKKKYRNVINKFDSGKDYTFKSPHDQATFEISSKIWGGAAVNGSSAFRAAPAAIEEDDDDLNTPNFADCQSPNPNGIDVNSKTPRPRKRNRAGVVKLEDKPHHAPVNSNINNNQPPAVVTPTAAPVVGTGITGSLSTVIEETVKSCLSPIFKELLSNSLNSNLNPSGPCCGHGFGLPRSPIPLCFAGATVGGDRQANDRWRKQQILELEVFSKRLELVQDQIREQLLELRSMGN